MIPKSTRQPEEIHLDNLFKIMADCAPVLLWMSRKDSMCIFFNETWLGFTGRSMEQEIGVGWVEGVYFEDVQACLDTYVAHFNQRTSFEMTYRLRRFDGEYRWILDKGVPYFDNEGVFQGFIGSCVDITENKLAQQTLEQINQVLESRVRERTLALEKSKQELKAAKEHAELANEIKSKFVSMVSHELRTPLTAIKGAIELIAHETTGSMSKNVKALCEIISKNTERLLRLINDILDLEKIAAGKIILRKKPQRLLPLIQFSIKNNEYFAKNCSVQLYLEPHLKDAYADVDADRLIQVLDNLLSNAIKVSPAHAQVTIGMQRINTHICISISDAGRGISSKLIPKIFSPFAQGNNTHNKRFKSTGLGLNIAKSIVEQHQGTIYFQTSKKGTTFFIELAEYK